jgi:transposase
LNNHGEGYLSLSQSKTDSDRVILFFQYFFEKLDTDDPGWKETSILLMDNASYHNSDETLEYLRRNNVAVFLSAPYSYDAAVAEMWFSYFKSKDLNAERYSTGKR